MSVCVSVRQLSFLRSAGSAERTINKKISFVPRTLHVFNNVADYGAQNSMKHYRSQVLSLNCYVAIVMDALVLQFENNCISIRFVGNRSTSQSSNSKSSNLEFSS